MLRKGINKVKFGFALLAVVAMTVMFQNCDSDSTSAPSVGANPTPPDVPPVTGLGTPTNDFSFNLNNGDDLIYTSGAGIVAANKSSSLQVAFNRVLQVSEVHALGASIDPELPNDYCADSVLPHCRHLNGTTGLIANPVQCSEDKALDQASINGIFAEINKLQVGVRKVGANDVQGADCDDPNLNVDKAQGEDFAISLAEESCVPDGKNYAINDSSALQALFDGPITALENAGDYCNTFLRYLQSSTGITYDSQSGFVPADQAESRHVEINVATATMRYRNPGDTEDTCAANVPLISTAEVLTFIPASGLNYKIKRTAAQLADAPTAQVVYKDAGYGANGEAKFYLDDATADTYGGGAVIDATQGQAMKDLVEALVDRAEQYNLVVDCQ